jgi:hypothetical protein
MRLCSGSWSLNLPPQQENDRSDCLLSLLLYSDRDCADFFVFYEAPKALIDSGT